MTVLRIEYFNQNQYRWSAVYETAVSNLEKAKVRFFKMKEMKRIENPDGTITRTIRKIDRLYDSSPVWSAAYPSTSCSCRAFDEFKKAEEKRNAERQAEYDEYRQKINSL